MQTQLINQYKKLVPFLASVLGPDYEIALYDVVHGETSLLAIYNPKSDEYKIGDPADNIERTFILQKEYLNSDSHTHYTSMSANGEALRSAVLFITDEEGELEGLLRTRFDSKRFQDVSQKIFELCHPDDYVAKNISINFDALSDVTEEDESSDVSPTLDAATQDIFSIVLENSAVPVEYLTNREKMDIVRLLQEKGVFLIKGAIPHVAQKLHCSTATLYRYLSKIKKDEI